MINIGTRNAGIFYKKGFTLIELLVVIAIISLLSSIVLASLNSARDKAADAAIISSLDNMRDQAALYYDENGTYVNFCSESKVSEVLNSASSLSGATAIDINVDPGLLTSVTCNDDDSVGGIGWAIQVPMKTNPSKMFCVDSTSHVVETLGNTLSGNFRPDQFCN